MDSRGLKRKQGTDADDFADVESLMTRVVAGDDGSAKRVAGAFPEASAAEGVVARVLVRDHGHEEFDEVILAGLVEVGMPEVSPLAGGTLVEFGGGVGGLGVTCNDGGDEDRRVVEAVVRCCDEFLVDGLGR